MKIDYDAFIGHFKVYCPNWDNTIKSAPDLTWDTTNRCWSLVDAADNMKFLRDTYVRKHYTPAATSRMLEYKAKITPKIDFPQWYEFKNQPMEKQWEALNLGWANDVAALFMEMGTGKTFVSINIAVARVMSGQADAIIVFCPTGVKPVWKIEMDKHCPIPYDYHIIESGRHDAARQFIHKESDGMKVMIIGIEALSQGKAHEIAELFVSSRKCVAINDESSSIKNPTTERTKRATNIASGCKFRIILNGTPITQGIEDLYSQFRFLNWKIMGQKSYFTFTHRYCVMGGFEGRKIIAYDNVNELMDKVRPYSVIITKKEMMDLPPKVYEPIVIPPSTAQKKALKELGDPFEMATVVDDHLLEVETILERMTRYQQIVGGHFPWKEGDESHIMRMPGKNPKMEEMMNILHNLPAGARVIIWARFIPEIEWIMEELNERWPGQTLHYYGATTSEEREYALDEFQDLSSDYRFFVSNPTMGGLGLTLTAATYTFYYSNTFSLKDRLQSEDRNHRKGQENKVTYVDLIMDHDIDAAMINALIKKQSIADYVKEELRREGDE